MEPELQMPFSRPKLGVEVTRYLRDAVLSGAFRPGQKLGVESLAQQLGISTMPVREALVALQSQAIVEGLPRRGFRVSEIHRRDVEDVFRVHAFVAGLLAEAASEVISHEDISALRRLQLEITEVAANDPSGNERSTRIEKLNFEFHSRINHAVDARRLRWFLRMATQFVPRYFYESIPGWTSATVEDHPSIIAALERRDSTQARELTSDHVSRAGALVVNHLSRLGFWHRPPLDGMSASAIDQPMRSFDASPISKIQRTNQKT